MTTAPGLSKSSFYWPIRLLPPEQRHALAAIYRWCSTVDAMIDSDGPPEEKAAALFAWRKWLADPTLPVADGMTDIAAAFAAAMTAYDVPRDAAEQLLDGFTMDIAGEMRAPPTMTLMRYCEAVAGAPGRMCLAVLGWRGNDANAFANAAGIAVQLTNILRDVAADARQDRMYIPREALDAVGIAAAAPDIVVNDKRLSEAWRAILMLAEARFALADSLLLAERRAHIKPALAMLAIYKRLLHQLKRRGFRPSDDRYRLPRWQAAVIAMRVMSFGR